MQDPSDSALRVALSRLALNRADEEGWRQLYTVTWPFVVSVTYRQLRGSRDEARDAAQEVFKRLVAYFDFCRLADAVEFRRYLRTMAVNVARDARSRGLPGDSRLGKSLRGRVARPNEAERPDDLAVAEQVRRKLVQALSREDRVLLALVLEGYALAEIANRMGLTTNAAAVRVHRLRGRVRRRLAASAPLGLRSRG